MFETIDTDMYRCKECSAVIPGEEARNNHACAKWTAKRPAADLPSRAPYKKPK